jgi:hypothetical protein
MIPIAFKMRSMTIVLPVALLAACIGDMDCPLIPFRMPAQPVHLRALSSHYDDWNCGDPEDYKGASGGPFLFSSNRGSAGGQFDLVPAAFSLHGEDTVLADDQPPEPWISRLAVSVNTHEDELGPSFWTRRQLDGVNGPGALVFSRGNRENHDLWAILPADGKLKGYLDTALLPQRSLEPLNTGSDEGYATWHPGWNRILFHSNRSGRYRIYQAEVPMDAVGPFAWLEDPSPDGVKVSEVAGLAAADGEERCPFLRGNTLYFISNRSGGQGGFDIYRSVFRSGAWSEPVNLGPSINSPADEYRPHPLELYNSGLGLLFSSNRPGGLGGYDLFLAGLEP